MIEALAALFATHGDVGHLALFLWAAAASALCLVLVREWARATRRFEAFVLAIAKLNALLAAGGGPAVPDTRPQRRSDP